MREILKVINDQMTAIGINYEFGRMSKSLPEYPYWVGEYTEPESMTEDGKEQPTIILTGFSRGKYLELETEKSKIKERFRRGVSLLTENGSAVYICYGGSIPIPQEDDDLKKIQVNLNIKYWKGN